MPRTRVLLVSESCNPDWVSLPLAGWGHTRALYDLVDLHLVTKAYNQEALLRTDIPAERITFMATDRAQRASARLLEVFRPNGELSWTTRTAFNVPEYYLFEYLIWKRFKQELVAGRFDLVHRLTPMSPVMPSYLARRLKAIGVPVAHRGKCFCIPEVGVFPDGAVARREGPVGLPTKVATTGRKVALGAEPDIVRGFRLALGSIVARPELRERARAHAWEHFTWPQKAKKTVWVYEWTLRRGPRPDLPFEEAAAGSDGPPLGEAGVSGLKGSDRSSAGPHEDRPRASPGTPG